MSIYEMIAGAILIVVCLVLVFLVISQESKQSGMGAFSGSSESYQNMQSRSVSAKAAMVTKYVAGAFFIVTIVVNLLIAFM